MKIFSIKDNKIGFSQVFVAPNNVAAIRMFGDTCKDKSTIFYNHPEDFELYALGEMDDNTGVITAEVSFLERATSFKENEKA